METKRYKIIFKESVEKSFSKLDNSDKIKIKKWMDKNLYCTTNPRLHGKSLTGSLTGLWRYRVDKYRILVDIQEEILIILVVDIEKRDKVYK